MNDLTTTNAPFEETAPANPFLRYLALGWSVIPLKAGGKLPESRLLPQVPDEEGVLKRRWKPYQAAPPTGAETEMWCRGGAPNVGIVTGPVSGIVVLDVDRPEAMEEARRRGLPRTPTVATGKGWHLYFRAPETPIGNRVNFADIGGFDLRGEGGYVVAPPSMHASGRRYEWLLAPEAAPLADLPAWITRLLDGEPAAASASEDGREDVEGGEPAEREPEREPVEGVPAADARRAAYVEQAVAAELEQFSRAREGERNDRLNRAAFALGQLGGAGVIDEAALHSDLLAAALRLGLSRREAAATIASGLKAGKREPRVLPEFTPRAASGDRGQPKANERGAEEAGPAGGQDTGGRREPQSAALIRLGLEATLFHAPTGEKYARYDVGPRHETAQIGHPRSPFRLWLERQFYRAFGHPPAQSALQQALQHLEQVAYYDGPCRKVYTRLGYAGDTVYLAVGDDAGHVIEIDREGWRLVRDAPVVFRSTRNAEPLPLPAPGGSVEALRPLLNLPDEATWKLCVGWMLGALNPWGPYAHLAPGGEQGSGKSSLLRVLRAFVDPAKAEENSEPRSVDDFMVTCLNNHVVSYDNLSHLPDWLSDALCRLATGAGLTKRMLYSDLDEIVIEAARPAILNGITDLVTRPDLLERTILFELPPIPPARRLPERRFRRRLAEVAPGVMGALLDAVVMALQRQDTVQLPSLPRMADFVLWVEAAAPALGWEAGAFPAAFEANLHAREDRALEADEVAETLVAWAQERLRGAGAVHETTMKELLAGLSALRLAGHDPDGLNVSSPAGRLPPDWPDSPRGLLARLARARPVLRRFGVEFERGPRRHRGQLYRIRRTGGQE